MVRDLDLGIGARKIAQGRKIKQELCVLQAWGVYTDITVVGNGVTVKFNHLRGALFLSKYIIILIWHIWLPC